MQHNTKKSIFVHVFVFLKIKLVKDYIFHVSRCNIAYTFCFVSIGGRIHYYYIPRMRANVPKFECATSEMVILLTI